jgi:5-methylcytosine-specific restriction endonuclease McrA
VNTPPFAPSAKSKPALSAKDAAPDILSRHTNNSTQIGRLGHPSVACKDKVGPGTGNKINYDHATAKSKGGNKTLNNTNVACEYCNKSKGAGDVPKNPKYPDQK